MTKNNAQPRSAVAGRQRIARVVAIALIFACTPPPKVLLRVSVPEEALYTRGVVPISVFAEKGKPDSVSLHLDDESLILAQAPPPYSYELDTAELPEGEHRVWASSEDEDGSHTTTTISIMVDRTAPAAPGVMAIERLGGGTVVLRGAAEPNALVRLTLETGELLATTTPFGTEWAVAVTMDAGGHTILLTAFDRAGNASVTTSTYVEVPAG